MIEEIIKKFSSDETEQPSPWKRQPIIAGNWKMNKTNTEAEALLKELLPLVEDVKDRAVVICPPATALTLAVKKIGPAAQNIGVGAQNVHWEESGAYTGELSAAMLKDAGVKYVIVGHSERREYFGETDETVNKRAKAAVAAGLIPIICVGESLETREANAYKDFVTAQVKKAFAGMGALSAAKCVVAYEPIWAIGTGKTATFEQAQEVCEMIRATLADLYDAEVSDAVRILYGGSVKPDTIDGLMEKPDVDGALVGGASLKAQDFSKIVKFGQNKPQKAKAKPEEKEISRTD
ncbi:MAG: triose-phosphate isomerase [Selenomonadaceae bacterium]|nr:triose-phosphate isomerase [Selenomonadaceae bacterium]